MNCIKSFQLGLVCFRAKGSDKLNQKLLSTINDSGKLHMVPARVNQRFTIRFALAAPNATASDVGEPIISSFIMVPFARSHSSIFYFYIIDMAWSIITDYLAELLESKVIRKFLNWNFISIDVHVLKYYSYIYLSFIES